MASTEQEHEELRARFADPSAEELTDVELARLQQLDAAQLREGRH